MSKRKELYISVDIEASGPIPSQYSMLSIGACLIDDPAQNFYCELKPINQNALPEALNVYHLSMTQLQQTGLDPTQAMLRFEQWLESLTTHRERTIFVGLNAAFDWSFINYYFWTFLKRNPFGISPLDIKAYFMATQDCQWSETTSKHMNAILHPDLCKDHNALHDALYQAELFRKIRKQLIKPQQTE